MATLTTTYTLILQETDASALKGLLGNISDTKMTEIGLTDEERASIHQIYYLLPDVDDD